MALRVMPFDHWNSSVNESQDKKKSYDEIIDSLLTSEAGKGLVKLGARVGSKSARRVTIVGLGPKFVVVHPDSPDNSSGDYESYSSFQNKPYQEAWAENLEDIWRKRWKLEVGKRLPSIPGMKEAQAIERLEELGVSAESQKSMKEIIDILINDKSEDWVDWESISQDPRIQQLEQNGFEFTPQNTIGKTLVRVAFPAKQLVTEYIDRVFPPNGGSDNWVLPEVAYFSLTNNPQISLKELGRGKGAAYSSVPIKGTDQQIADRMIDEIAKRWQTLEFYSNRMSDLVYPSGTIKIDNWNQFGFGREDLYEMLNRGLKGSNPFTFFNWLQGPGFKEFLRREYSSPKGNVVYAYIHPDQREVEVKIDPKNIQDYNDWAERKSKLKLQDLVDFIATLPDEIADQAFPDSDTLKTRARVNRLII